MLASDPETSTLFVEGKCYNMPLLEENNFLPDYDAIPKIVAGAKLMFIGYPNNPTGAVAPMTFFNETVEFAKNNDIIVVPDNAYSEISYDGYKVPSFLQASGVMDVGIETYSLPKTYNMTGVKSVKTVRKTFIHVDVGFALLIRPAMYDSWHEVTMASKADAPAEITATVTGPICETGDILAADRKLPETVTGDVIAVLDAGAYGYAMSWQYNSRPRCSCQRRQSRTNAPSETYEE